MKGKRKGDKQLLQELQRLRRRVSELETSLEKTRAADTVPFPGGEYMRYLLDHSFDLIVVVDREGKVIYLTPSIESQLGYPREEVLGANAFNYIHPEDVQRISEFYNKRLGYGGYSRKVEFRIKHRDGSWRYMEAVGNNLLDNPEVQGIVVNARDITDRVQVEKELREAEEKYRTIIDSANDAVFIHDLSDGQLLFTNKMVTEMYGYTFEELHGLGLAAFETHQEPYTLKNLVALGLKAAKGEPQLFEWRPRDKKGNPFWVEVNIKRSFIAGRHCIISVVRDISERKKAQEELIRSEEYFRSLIEHTSDIIAVLDADGTVRYVSPSISRISGDKPEDVIGKSSFENIHPDDISSLIKVFSEGLKTRGVTASAEYRIRHKDGSWHTYHGVGQNLLDNPYIRGIVVHSTDITERKRLEEELQRSEEYFRSLIENASDILVVVTADGVMRYVGPSVERVTGYKPEELVGKNIFDFAHPDDMRRSARDLARAVERGGVTQYAEIRIRHKDGSWHYYEASSNNLLDNPAVLGVVINARDITERKEAESFNRIQRDIAVSLSGANTLKEALRISLEGILEATGMNGGAIYLVDKETGDLDLAFYSGFSEAFITEVSHYDRGDPATRAVMTGEPIYGDLETVEILPAAAQFEEGLKVIAVVPIRHEGEVIGCLNLASHTMLEVPQRARHMIEILAGQVGQSIVHARLVSALRESEEKYRLFYEYAGQPIYTYDTNLRLIGVNQKACELIGYPEEELMGRPIFELDILHPDDLERTLQDIQRLFNGEVVNDELRFIRKDGSIYIGDVTGAPLYNQAGEIIAFTNIARDITELKQAEEALRESEQKFRALAETATTAILIYSGDRLLYVNPAAVEMSGYSERELLEVNIWDLVHPDHRETARRAAYEQLEGELLEPPNEVVYFTRDGEERWVFANASRIDYEGRPAGLVEVIDITDRKKAEEALRESEERYRLIFDYSGEAIFIYDRELRLTGINLKACQLIGYREEELIGKNIFELGILHSDDYQKGFRNNQRIFGGEVVNAELRFITKDGAVLVAEVTGAPLYNREGEVIAVTNVARDVTERKHHQERLHKLNQCFLGLGPDPLENIKSITLAGKDILEGFAVQYCRLDRGRFSYFLPSREGGDFVRPESPEDYICFDCILSNLDQPLIIEDLGGAPANNDPLVKEKEYESFLGYPTRLSGKTVGALCLYGKGEGGFAQEDINFLGMLARALTIEEERLAHEESIRHFVDIASHELRTPLSIIKGYADAFEQGDLMELNRFQMDKIRIINAKADKMTKTINDLMHLSRIERGQFMIEKQEVDLENLIQGVLEQMREKGLRNNFSLSIPEGMECCEADPEKLGDALRILLDNAVNYSPPASDIEVRTMAGDGGVVISVLDRGWGIEEKDRARIFERFYQGEDSRHHSASGMGLGLFIAREIVEGHGGRIWYEPREGGGSIFSLSIPT